MPQRITNGMMVNTFNRNLMNNSVRMDKIQSQLATNRKIVRLSDDPVGVIKSINARSKLNDIGQFGKNVQDASAWMTSTETAVTEVNTVLKRAYELMVQAANDPNGLEDLKAIGDEIIQLRDHIVQIGNTTLGDKYIFGGFNVSTSPFVTTDEDGLELGYVQLNGSGEQLYNMTDDDPEALNAANTTLSYEIGFSIYMDIGIGPVSFMGAGEDNLFKIFNDMYHTLYGLEEDGETEMDPPPNNTTLQPYIAKLQEAQRRSLATLAELGGRQNRLELVTDRYGQDTINYTQMKSDAEDLDQAEAIMNFSMMEAVYRAALSVGSRVIQPTLVDFLR
ncbi:flagellar hook-associated protein FlgL [Clostridia bacterium]|nr:flagellar hook-associated protein FlgL [Clostridia bacterium]